MGQSIFSKIKSKLQKKSEEDEDDSAELSEDTDSKLEDATDEEIDEEIDEEEEDVPASSSFMDKVKAQLPFLTKIFNRKSKNDSDEDEDIEEEQEAEEVDRNETRTKMEDLDDATGDIDVSALDMDEEGLESDDQFGDDKALQIQTKIAEGLTGLSQKLPFLAKLLENPKVAESIPKLAQSLSKVSSLVSRKSKKDEDEDLELEKDVQDPHLAGAKPKRKIQIKHLIVAFLAIAVLMEFLPTDEETKPDETASTEASPRPIRKKNPVKKPETEDKPEQATSPEQVAETKNVPEVTPETEVVKTVQTTTPMDELDTTPEDVPSSSDIDFTSDSTPSILSDTTGYDDSEDKVDVGEELADTDESTTDEMDLTASDENTGVEDLEQDNGESTPVDPMKVVDLTSSDDFGDKLSNTILKDLEKEMKQQRANSQTKILAPTDAPDYENLGRGLVYNCTGMHWACVDKDSYEVCKQNNAWNRQQKKGKECVPIQVYSDREDCEIVQQHKIDSVAKTDFCKI